MPSTPTLVFTTIFLLVSLASMLPNGFMIIVLGREWMRNKALPAADMIVASLAFSRFCLHAIAILTNLLASFDFCYQANLVGILWDFINTLIFWLTAWLAVFYCVKISSFSHPVLFWLKWRISQLVPRLLLGSLIMGGLSAVMSATMNIIAHQITISHGNCTFGHMTLDFFRYYYLSYAMLMWFTPFFLFLVSIVLLMVSLRRHVEKMRGHRPGPCDPHTQAHTMALKSLTFFLIFYALFFLSLIISSTKIKTMQSYWYWAREVIIYTGIFLNSIILVLSNPKLRKSLKMRF